MTSDEIEPAIIAIIKSTEANIPENVRSNHFSLVRAREYSVALDFVEDWLVEEGRPVPVVFYDRILAVRAYLGERGRCEDYIRKHLLAS